MFKLDIKQSFNEKIYDVLIVLCIIHLGTVIISLIIKQVHHYLKDYIATYNNGKKVNLGGQFWMKSEVQSKPKYHVKEAETLFLTDSDNSGEDEDYVNTINNLKSLGNVFEVSPYLLKKNSRKNEKMQDIIFDDIINFRKILTNKLKQNNCSNETQTKISINPEVTIDFSSHNFVLSPLFSEIPIHPSVSSDCFQSASSGNSESDCENEYVPVIRHFTYCDILNQKEKRQNAPNNFVYGYNNVQQFTENSETRFDLENSSNKDCEKHVGKKNKMLEIAIREFEKELNPIKEEINALKECLIDFDNGSVQNSLPSDFSSSVTGTIGQSDCFSEVLSSTCSTQLHGCTLLPHTLLEKKYFPFKTKLNCINAKISPDNLSKNSEYNRHKLTHKKSEKLRKELSCFKKNSFPECNQLNKHSPLAEMYIKLSQHNSQPACFMKSKRHNIVKYSEEDKTFTYCINLNVDLKAMRDLNIQKNNCSKERQIQPLLSEPEDILKKPSATNVCLKTTKHPIKLS